MLLSMQGGIDTKSQHDAPLGRALVLTGSVGSGHTRAAQAVVEAMLRSGAAEQAEVVDVLAHSWKPFRALYRDAYVGLIERAPTAVGWLYRSSDTTEGGGIRRAIQRQALARMRRRIIADRPDTIVCSHFLAAELVHGMVERGEWRGTFGVVVTDLDAHALWAACPSADRWFVAIPETAEILVGKGVARDRIVVSGIPIMGAFSAKLRPRSEIRASLGLSSDRQMVLVSGGGVGVSNLGGVLEALLRVDVDCGIALVCGKNQALRTRAEAVVRAVDAGKAARCVVLGFTDRMHELMHASDLSIGKPGGLTTSESLAMGLPIAIINPVPGQEERNSDHLLEWGVAIRLNSSESMGWRIQQLLADSRRLESMRRQARARGRPFAADMVVDVLRRLRLGESGSMPARVVTRASARAARAGRATTRREAN